MIRTVARGVLALLFVGAGTLHLVRADTFVRIVPPYLPHAEWLVAVSGVCEILGAIALLVPRTRRFGAWGLIALLVAVFPANINMALHPDAFRDMAGPVFLWVRLPIQFVFIAWVVWCGDLVRTVRPSRV